jgi:predicted metal-binding protein
VIGPDEDPAKCVCKGTGVIIHGDGHKTPCPFHSKSTSKTKGSIKHDYINQILTKFTKSQQEAEKITNAILENRPVKERVYLKRNAPRKSNN